MVFPENMNPLEIELYCYALTRGDYGRTMRVKKNMELSDYKLLSPYEHFIIAVQYMWPTDVVIKNRGYTNTQLLRTLEECVTMTMCVSQARPQWVSHSQLVCGFIWIGALLRIAHLLG